MTTTTYVATVAPFDTAATEDSGPLARVRYVTENHTFVRVTRVQHDVLPAVTGYGIEFWLTVDTLARQVHRHILELIAARKIHQVTSFQELSPEHRAKIDNSPELADLGPNGLLYVHLRVTDLLRFG
ncbi:Uncharacterised protein [Mycobacteroides abscessus]|uniref:Uncharacterized protein n=1 Tax=Mycolicibacterium llatzerense TaxID=280871 RepID=A0A0D1KXZ5_9MYCO|nr:MULTISPECIES: hypothetical protein [Mycobacteriaceae]KIU13640.1 hypothetical protein TL10_28780 [Mycolicibacterium llatzerense]MCT7372576.1 hypothetical protein [Mycolicibacterium llatzerense]WGI35821.1 hypothetical protein QDT91_28190 [Mycolicibacterium aubagnense]CPT78079.1 Uncharacterised protein [Mycobacteroides abscessus]CPU63234.1 Uncharacterised protein [Mycobacteroides abscessus]